jgi:hypothetical protein
MGILHVEWQLGPPDESSELLWIRILLMGRQGLINTEEFRRMFDELHARREYVADPNAFSAIRLLGLKYTDLSNAPTKAASTGEDQPPWRPFEIESMENNIVKWSLKPQQHNDKAAAVLL